MTHTFSDFTFQDLIDSLEHEGAIEIVYQMQRSVEKKTGILFSYDDMEEVINNITEYDNIDNKQSMLDLFPPFLDGKPLSEDDMRTSLIPIDNYTSESAMRVMSDRNVVVGIGKTPSLEVIVYDKEKDDIHEENEIKDGLVQNAIHTIKDSMPEGQSAVMFLDASKIEDGIECSVINSMTCNRSGPVLIYTIIGIDPFYAPE